MKNVVAFDFDGTITNKDSFIRFIIFSKGYLRFIIGFIIYSPLLILFKLKLFDNTRMKVAIFSWFFKGVNVDRFNELCYAFCETEITKIVRASAITKIHEYKQENDTELVLVSASIENWLMPWANKMGFNTVLATQIEVKNGVLTGQLSSTNCHGQEKVSRLLAEYPNRDQYTLISYGDSSGDKELIAFSDNGNYKYFK